MISDVLPFIDECRARNEQLGLATVVRTYGSAPRQVGAKMAVSATGTLAGSVSGGCVEGAVFEALQEAIASGQPRLLHFGVADEQAWEVGLACGGQIDVFVERLDW
jgi:xanthine/CO dehydrogenase XdhC/CoxF family maturation factor